MKIQHTLSRPTRTLLALMLSACAVEDADELDEPQVHASEAALDLPWEPSAFTPFTFSSQVSESGQFSDGDVRLDRVEFGHVKLPGWALQTVKHATILIDDGVDVARGGHNFASGQGINSELDEWVSEGPATITPTGADLRASLDNLNLTSIVVTRENEGTASLEVSFAVPVNTLFFWERGSAASPTTANSDLLVEALDWKGEVTASYKLLRSQYTPTGIEITTWNGSFASPSTPGGAFPQLGSAGLALDGAARRFRLTSVQRAPGGVRDDGPDYKLVGALLPSFLLPR
ncbi:MAG: hypothetical protein QM778_12535 [Myxococcales bacterium]